MSEQMSQSQGPKWIALAAGLVVAGGIGFWLFQQNQPKMVTQLYRYYPQNTGFFAEMKPSSAMASKVMRGLDGLVTVVSEKKGIAAPPQVAALFEKDFEPTMAAGAWVSQSPDMPTKPVVLGVITLKSSVKPETVLADLKLPADQFEQLSHAGATLYASRTPRTPSLAFHNRQLLVAEDIATLKAAIDEYKTPESVITAPFIKQHLGELAADREGTVFVISDEIQKLTPKPKANPLQAPFEAFQEKIRPAFPGTLAAIQITDDRLIEVQSSSPLEADKITDTALRSDIVALMGKKALFSMPQTMPQSTTVFAGMVDLAGYYDFFLKHIATEDAKKSVDQAGTQLKMMGLDLRKNIVALLEGPAALGVTNETTTPQVALFFNQSPETTKTLEQLSAMAAQMTGGRVVEKQLDGQTRANVIESRMIPLSIGYSAAPKQPLVLATTSALEAMATVSSGKAPSVGDSALYKELTGHFPQQVNNLVYLNTQHTAKLVEFMAKTQKPSQTEGTAVLKQLLEGVEGLAMATTMDGQRMVGYTVVKLSK